MLVFSQQPIVHLSNPMMNFQPNIRGSGLLPGIFSNNSTFSINRALTSVINKLERQVCVNR